MIIRGISNIRQFVASKMGNRFTITQLAYRAMVCRSTVARLISDNPKTQTRSPHFLTVLKIVRALGYKINIK